MFNFINKLFNKGKTFDVVLDLNDLDKPIIEKLSHSSLTKHFDVSSVDFDKIAAFAITRQESKTYYGRYDTVISHLVHGIIFEMRFDTSLKRHKELVKEFNIKCNKV